MDSNLIMETVFKYAKQIDSIIIDKSELTHARGNKTDSFLGKGGFGAVFLRKYKGEEAVLKKISLMKAQESDIELIFGEIKSMKFAYSFCAKIPKFYGIYKGRKKIGIVMEFIKGVTLLKLYKDISDRMKIEILIQITEILNIIHSKKLIHRDLKPDNIMVNIDNPSKPIVYLIDFGLCTIAKNTRTRTGSAKGTSQYKAPELFDDELQINGEENDLNILISYKIDIWALGAMMSEVFSGKIPWSQLTTNWIHIETCLSEKKEFPIPDIHNIKIHNIVKKCLHNDPNERPCDLEIIEELNKAKEFCNI